VVGSDTPAVNARPRARVLSACLLVLTGALSLTGTTASAQTAATAVATADYATELFGDPWDFSNPEDLLLDGGLTLDAGGPTVGLRDAEVRAGQLTWSMSRAGYLSPVWGGYPGALYLGREAGAPERQVDASRFTRLSIHMFASQPRSPACSGSAARAWTPRAGAGSPSWSARAGTPTTSCSPTRATASPRSGRA
jgi:hypothetical protein